MFLSLAELSSGALADSTGLLSIAGFVLLLAVLVIVRLRWTKFEVKTGDIAAAALPIVLFLMIDGRIKSFQWGDLKMETAFKEASATSIRGQVATVTALPVDPVRAGAKGGPAELRRLREDGAEGLKFILGSDRYVGGAIHEYLSSLPTLRHLIIERENGDLFGIATVLAASGADGARTLGIDPDDLAEWLNAGDGKAIAGLPGFVSAEHAVQKTTDKQEALRRMEALNTDVLPVVDDGGRFVGVVNRSRVTASMLVDIAERLKG